MTGNERALVLGGGGAAGNAWELGLIAGLAEGGVDLLRADLIVGTSAGSTVAAQVTSGTAVHELYAAILAEESRPPRDRAAGTGATRGAAGQRYVEWTDAVIAASDDAADMRRRIGAAALADTDPARQAGWRSVVATRLPSSEWPAQRLRVTAVDARTGEPVVFDRDSGVALVDAVAASTGHGYPIGERVFVNGGYRRSENADLAKGFVRVLVLSPFGGRTRMPLAWRMDLASQVEDLRGTGSLVETVVPDSRAGAVFDANALDPATRAPAARGGFEQGRELAGRLVTFWG